MSETKHTPGPWELEFRDYAPDSVVVRMTHANGKRHRYLIAGWAETNGSEGWLADAEAMSANARLIAAAPELLEALTDLVLCHSDGGFVKPGGAVLANARAAIASATGATQ